MGSITLQLPVAGTTIAAGLHSANYTALQTLLNGNLDATNLAPGTIANVPVGSVFQYAGSSAPTGYLFADGSEQPRATYSALDAVITTIYGAYTNGSGGAGTSHLRLPDLRQRVPVGKHSSGTFVTLGGTGGAETHTLTTAQMPVHNHGVSDPGHDHPLMGNSGVPGAQGSINIVSGTQASTGGLIGGNFTGITINNNGSGNSHNNLQPYIVINYIIKT